jgi:FADH2 O2-dependent halogenase
MMKFDFLVVGSGYGGSILSAILSKAGNSVLMIDRDHHPRFAIGESSTPISDATLTHLADKHGIPEFRQLACYGNWRATFPNLRCGIKRGFSYFAHTEGHRFQDTPLHEYSSFVAASANDYYSDTHWMRSDTDAYFARLAEKHGTHYNSHTTVGELNRGNDTWQIELKSADSVRTIKATWIIDATGHGGFSRQRLNAGNLDHQLHTRARTIFGHFDNFDRMSNLALDHPAYVLDPNFDPDDAAQHHIVHNGWIWILRFGGSLASVGLMTTDFTTPLDQQWHETCQRYPTFAELLSSATLVDSTHHQLRPMDRMYRTEGALAKINARAFGDGWVALPNAFGFIDPLHSTGIAHNLTGIRRLADIFMSPSSEITSAFAVYEQKVNAEVRWIDQLVALCFSGLPNTRLFMDLTTAYFVAVIAQEQASLSSNHISDDFLSVSNREMRNSIGEILQDLQQSSPEEKERHYQSFRRRISKAMAPWNSVGLLCDSTRNRVSHSAVAKWRL